MNEEAKAHVDALRNEMVEGRSIEEIEKSWDHYHRLETYFEMYHAKDRRAMESLRRLKDGLSYFTRDVRGGALSPYFGFGVELTSLRSYLEGGYGADGYPR